MAKYQLQTAVGAWVDKNALVTGTRAKIVNEAKKEPSKFLNEDGTPKMQDNCKVLFEGKKDPVNVSLNRATLHGLIQAFGTESKDWQNQYLTVEVEKMRVAGKAVIALYLIPNDFKKIDDEEGFAKIVPINKVSGTDIEYPEQAGEIPF